MRINYFFVVTMELKKVLVITDRNFSTSLGRTAILFCEALGQFATVDCAVVVSNRFFSSDSDVTAIPQGFAIVKRQTFLKNIFVSPVREIETQFLSKKYDFIILCHQFMGYLVPAFKKRFKSSKVITMVHDIFPFMLYKQSVKNFLLKKFFFDGIFRSDGLIFNSEHSKDIFNTVFSKNVVTEKTFSVGLGIDTQNFFSVSSSERDLLKEKWGIDKSKKIIFNIGLGEWRKNNSLFVSLAKNLPDCLFLRLGKFEPKLEGQAQDLKNMRLFANLPIHQVRELHNMADVYVMPSYFEGFSLTGLEAMCCSTPVVASCMSAHREVYSGLVEFVYDPDNVAGFARKIETLLKKDVKIDKDKLAQRLDYYSNNKFGERALNFFGSIA